MNHMKSGKDGFPWYAWALGWILEKIFGKSEE